MDGRIDGKLARSFGDEEMLIEVAKPSRSVGRSQERQRARWRRVFRIPGNVTVKNLSFVCVFNCGNGEPSFTTERTISSRRAPPSLQGGR